MRPGFVRWWHHRTKCHWHHHGAMAECEEESAMVAINSSNKYSGTGIRKIHHNLGCYPSGRVKCGHGLIMDISPVMLPATVTTQLVKLALVRHCNTTNHIASCLICMIHLITLQASTLGKL